LTDVGRQFREARAKAGLPGDLGLVLLPVKGESYVNLPYDVYLKNERGKEEKNTLPIFNWPCSGNRVP